MAGETKRPKLIFLVSEDWYFVSHRLALAKAALAAGYDVVVATRVRSHGRVITDAGLKLRPIAFERSGLNPLRDALNVKALIDLYRNEKPDIAHHIAVKPVVLGALAARAAGVTRVVNALMGLGFVFSSETAKARTLRPIVRAALKSSLSGEGKRVIVQNHEDAQMLAAGGWAGPGTIRLILGSGVDPDQFSPGAPPDGVPLVVLPARLLRDKGVTEFIGAARRVKARGIEARFVLAGDPDPLNPSSLKMSEIETAVASGAVEHWGWRTDMPEVLRAASLVCLPSYREGLPKALLEAAATGRAIIATDVPGCREIVRTGVNGWLVPPRDESALADALAIALAEPARSAAYGAAGRQMVLAEFAASHIIRQTLGVYRELLGAAAAPENADLSPPR